jgi:hypothetical protein
MIMSLLSTLAITRLAVRLFKNSNAFIQNIDTQYSDQFAVDGAKIGDTLRIRLPNDYTVADGPALSAQDTNEQSTSLVVNIQRHVDTQFTSAQLSLTMQDFSERVAAPMMNVLAGNIAKTVMAGVEGGVSNFVANTDGSGAIIAPTAQTFLNANALLTNRSAQSMDRNMVVSPNTMANAVGTMQGLFNPVTEISRQFRKGQVYDALNFRWFEDPTCLLHTTGTFTAGTVNGAGQSGLTLVTNATTGTLKKGDIITIAGVNSVNRVTKQDDGVLQQFVVTADAATAATSLSIYPAIVAPATSGPAAGADVQYQTCATAPANGAAIALVNTASEVYKKNVGYVPQLVTMATCDLKLPSGNGDAARANADGLAIRVIRNFYNAQTDAFVDRIDCLMGFLYVRPEWGVIVGSPS